MATGTYKKQKTCSTSFSKVISDSDKPLLPINFKQKTK